MKKLTKEEALLKIEELEKYIKDEEEKPKGVVIKNRYTDEIIFQSSKNTIKKAVEEAIENGISLCEANLYKANLYEADLYKADLYNANLSEADLYNANLGEADLYKANLCKANLYEADLYKADLYNANLSEANLYKADLSEADLSEADLCGVELYHAKFQGRGGNTKISISQLKNFLKGLGVFVKD